MSDTGCYGLSSGESSAAGAARQDGPAIAREDPYS
ncbi:hypothetical protein Tco_1573266, partial [Tanacetum coccineum]